MALRLVSGDHRSGVEGHRAAGPPLLCPQPKGVKERRPESGRWLYCTRTPLGDQESMLTEETQNPREKKVKESAKHVLHFSGFNT